MKRRFSERELRELRNEIPVEELIENHLGMPVERVSGRFRFSCPICSGYDTSVLYEKNLARCFSCRKNFNTIDLTMSLTSLDFVGAASKGSGSTANQENQPKRKAKPVRIGTASPPWPKSSLQSFPARKSAPF